jgi:hypothetical protein
LGVGSWELEGEKKERKGKERREAYKGRYFVFVYHFLAI